MPPAHRNVIRAYADAIRHEFRTRAPGYFAPAHALAPYSWLDLPYDIIDVVDPRPAIRASIALTRSNPLRELYEQVDLGRAHGLSYVYAQLRNLVRRSLILSVDDASYASAFNHWFPRYVRWLNRTSITRVEVAEFYGVTLGGRDRSLSIDHEALGRDTSRSWVERGSLTDFVNRHRILRPRDLESTEFPGERPKVVIVRERQVPKDEHVLTDFSAGADWTYGYERALRMLTGDSIPRGSSLFAELGSFPISEPHVFSSPPPFRWSFEEQAPLALTRKLHRLAHELRPRLSPVTNSWRQFETSPMAYAEEKCQRLVEGKGPWFVDVVDTVSALEALFGGDRTELSHRVAQRAAWLAPVTDGERTLLFSRIRALYGCRSAVLHSGAVSRKVFDDTLKALDIRPPGIDRTVGGVRESEYGAAWADLGRPRLSALLRWAVLHCLELSSRPADASVRWPIKSRNTDIDADILTGRNVAAWRLIRHPNPSPLAKG